MTQTEAQKRAVKKWRKGNMRSITLHFYVGGDADIIAFLDATENKSRAVKDAIRAYIAHQGQDTEARENGAL
ncbi:MAG: hypothetical protein J6S63_01325 [Atopobiaceae bacterium]|nr:hypothetical protein [Atopobiaceae bacterium]